MQGIGVDADQAYLGDQIMTSALKKVDVAVFDEIKAVQDGTFKGGANTIFDVKSGGVGIGDTNDVGAKYADQVKEVQDKIASGELTDIPDTVEVTVADAPALELRRHHQAVRDPGREPLGGLRAAPWRDPRAARGERRGQVDPDERPLRAPPARRGQILLDGEPVSIDSPRRAIGLGIGMVHQHFMLVPVMTVAENLVLGAEPQQRARCWTTRRRPRACASCRSGSAWRSTRTRRVEDLGVGAQQRVEILRALFRGAKVLVLDEPTAVLTAQEAQDLFVVLRTLTAEGTVGRLHLAQAQRGARRRRPRDGPAARREGRHRADRGRHRALAGAR